MQPLRKASSPAACRVRQCRHRSFKIVKSVEGDEKTGVKIIARALEARQADPKTPASMVPLFSSASRAPVRSATASTREIYTDMIKAGIVDPTKVTRSALEKGASVAAMILTTESLVAEKKEPVAPAAPASPDMGGMY